MTTNHVYITETFRSVQGETSLTGWPTFFIRLSGCNLRCTWCDTTYSFSRGEKREIEDLVEESKLSGCSYVCLTGGEPLLQPGLVPLAERLLEEGFTVSLETGGSLTIANVPEAVKVILDIKCPKSGMAHKNHLENIPLLKSKDEVKFVIGNREDFEFSRDFIAEHALFEKTAEILFSPVWGAIDPKQLVEWILEAGLPVRLQLQLHKIIWPNVLKGV